MKTAAASLGALLSGFVSGGIPLVLAGRYGSDADPFDQLTSYIIWCGGSFTAALAITYILPHFRRLAGLAVFVGFGAALVVDIGIAAYDTHRNYQFLPFTLIIWAVIGIPSAYIGVYSGAALRRDASS
jgi:hypothetical protein